MLQRPLLRVLSVRSAKSLFEKFVHRTFQLSQPTMGIKVGDKIPSIELYEENPTKKINIAELCAGKKVVLFAVPGAFTPGCSKTHLPGYVEKAEELKKSGVAEIICLAVNDPFVMDAWGKEHGVNGKIRMLADPNAEFTKALELDTCLPPLGGTRSKRYSMVVDDGVVCELNVEPDGTGLNISLADKLSAYKAEEA